MAISNITTTSPALNQNLRVERDAEAAEPRVRKKRGIALKGRTWPQHSMLRISLSNMTEEQKTMVKKGILEWSPYTNLHFKFVNSDDGDIRISGNSGSGSWSAIGTRALAWKPSEPTMSIDFANTEETVRADVLHEFGHALGLMHEHLHPQRSLSFNAEATYKHFEGRDFKRDEVDAQILEQVETANVKTSEYDKTSIMHYPFPAVTINNGDEIPFPTQLSDGDKNFISSLYPRDDTPPGKILYTLRQILISSS